MRKAVIILSGGMDSTTLAYDIVKSGKYDEVHALSFDYGQKHGKELECAKITASKLGLRSHHVVDVSGLGGILSSALTGSCEVPEGDYDDSNQKLTVVPNRNMIMLSIAAGYAMSIGATDLYYGAHANDFAIYPDCRPVFVEKMNEVLSYAHYTPVKLIVPYQFYGKANIAAKGEQLGVPFEDTWTCYKGGEKPCGKCGSCNERLMAFKGARMTDPLEYEE
jgi:7-cyano-7-deazaguanine synthase